MSIRASISRIDILKFLCKEYESKIETLMCKQKYIIKSVNTPMEKIRTGNFNVILILCKEYESKND